MSIFKYFENPDFESIFNVVKEKVKNIIKDELNPKTKYALENTNLKFEKIHDFKDINDRKIGNIYSVKLQFADKIYENDGILILTPDENGYFYNGHRKIYSPWVVFDKFDEENNSSEDHFSEDKNQEDSKIMNLENSIILPGYYLSIMIYLIGIICSIEKTKKKNNEKKENFVELSLLNQLSDKIGVHIFKLYIIKKGKGNDKNLWVKIPIFFEPEELNYIEKKTNPFKVVYPSEQVSEIKRKPNSTQKNILDMLETPESEKIGLNLTLVDSKNLSYDFEKLNFVNKSSEITEDNSLSYATKQIPFLLHSDGARVLMGAKNLKQSIKVTGAEKPIISTGYEDDFIGVNALVVYGLYKGFNFEDGIVVSKKFAEKMKIITEEKKSFIIRTENIKTPSKEDNLWIYKNKKIFWKKKEGDPVKYGDIIFTESENGKNFHHRYTGKYEAIILKLPIKPEIPLKNKIAEENEYYIKINILFRVTKPLDIGDKIMGRHGNKGTVSLILSSEEMPKVKINGEEKNADMILSPLGVVSRMNIGQLYEVHMSLAYTKGKICKPFFNAYTEKNEILGKLKEAGSDNYGRFEVSGYNNRLVCGYQYFVRLDHCVRDKIHFISEAKESKLTCQPMKGKSRNGGQKIGEMEFWALLSYNNTETVKLFKNLNTLKTKKEKPEEVYLKIFKKAGIVINPEENFTLNVSKDKNKKDIFDKTISDIFEKKIKNQYLLKYLYDDNNKVLKDFVEEINIFAEKNKLIMNEKIDKIDEEKYKEFEKILKKYGNILKIEISDKSIKNKNNIIKFTKNKTLRKLTGEIINILKYPKKYIKKDFNNLMFGKNGYGRSYIIARRIHNSGRTVITPQPSNEINGLKLNIDNVILPIEFGLEMLKTLNFKSKIMNSEIALKGDNKKRKEVAKELNKIFEKNYPEKLVILNRQPSLFRHSMQSFYPKFWENYTIGLPILVCQGFNADFDGDTMAVYFPAEQNEIIQKELEKMLPSVNPFSISNSELNYSIDQDLVYGKYLDKFQDKKAIKNEIKEDILKNKSRLTEYLSEISEKYLKTATENSLTLGIYEIEDNSKPESSMFKIEKSKCRGKDDQFKQLYLKIDGKNENFLNGISPESYFDVKNGVASRARRTLMDKKLHVADAGYFTRKLTEFLGSIYTDNNYNDYYEIDLKNISNLKTYNDVQNFIMNRYIKLDGKEIFVDYSNFKEISKNTEKIKLLSPKIKKETVFVISEKYLGKDISTLENFSDKELIGLTAGHVLGERGTQLSMETFHSGSKGLNMNTISSYIFKKAFSEKNYLDFLKELDKSYEEILNEKNTSEETKIKKDNDEKTVLEKINPYSIYFEILYNFSQYMKNELNIKSYKQFFKDTELRGFLTCITFENSETIIEETLNKVKDNEITFFETHPRVRYSFFKEVK